MKRDNLSKNYLLNKIQANLGIPRSLSKDILETFLSSITNGLIRDGKVKLSGFGTFKILIKKQRIGRNPRNKVEYKISPRKVVTFYLSQGVKKRINN